MGTALNLHSRVWFTLSHGILNEIYFPRVDQACTRDQGLIVTDGSSLFLRRKAHTANLKTMPIEPGVPVYELTNTELQGRYRIEKEVFSDPYRNVVLQRIRFVPLQGKLADYRLYALLAPHLANCGRGKHRLGRRLQRHAHAVCPAQATALWPSPAPLPGGRCQSASPDFPTDGRISPSTTR